MISNTASLPVQPQKTSETAYGIRSASDMVHIFNVLRSKLYSNKYAAVIREYSTNAHDAHVLVGTPTRPFVVHLPTINELFFSVRDFGPGLSEQDVRNTFCMYGASSKRDSNEFNGQLGFGSKSAFAYTDKFYISSYFDGVCKTFLSSATGAGGLGTIDLISEEKSDEEPGLLIKVPVEEDEISDFRSNAEVIYPWFITTPIVNATTAIVKRKPTLTGDGWSCFKNHGCSAIMGNISYNLDKTAVLAELQKRNLPNYNFYYEWLYWKYANGIALHFDIGELSIAASRESLEYDSSTLKALCDRLISIVDGVQGWLDSTANECKTKYEFLDRLRTFESQMFSMHSIKQYNSAIQPRYNGHDVAGPYYTINIGYLPEERFEFDKYGVNEAKMYRRGSGRYGSSSSQKTSSFDLSRSVQIFPDDTISLFFNDCKDTNDRVRTILNAEPHRKVYVLSGDYDKIVSQGKIEPEMLPRLSTIHPTKPTPKAGGKANVKSAYSSWEFKYASGYNSKNSDSWNSIELKDLLKRESIIYVVVDRFEPVKYYNNHGLKSTIDEFKAHFPEYSAIQVFGVREQFVKELKQGIEFTEFAAWCAAEKHSKPENIGKLFAVKYPDHRARIIKIDKLDIWSSLNCPTISELSKNIFASGKIKFLKDEDAEGILVDIRARATAELSEVENKYKLICALKSEYIDDDIREHLSTYIDAINNKNKEVQ